MAATRAHIRARLREIMGRDHGLLENTQESLRARATVSAELCAEVVECRYWDDEKNAWRADNCRTVRDSPVPDDNTTGNAAGGEQAEGASLC